MKKSILCSVLLAANANGDPAELLRREIVGRPAPVQENKTSVADVFNQAIGKQPSAGSSTASLQKESGTPGIGAGMLRRRKNVVTTVENRLRKRLGYSLILLGDYALLGGDAGVAPEKLNANKQPILQSINNELMVNVQTAAFFGAEPKIAIMDPAFNKELSDLAIKRDEVYAVLLDCTTYLKSLVSDYETFIKTGKRFNYDARLSELNELVEKYSRVAGV